jgi:hypothetical protein
MINKQDGWIAWEGWKISESKREREFIQNPSYKRSPGRPQRRYKFQFLIKSEPSINALGVNSDWAVWRFPI